MHRMKKITEEWRPIKGYEGLYDVSNMGRVRALFYGNHGQFKPGRILKPNAHQNEYLFVGLYLPGTSQKAKARSVHSLVLEAFHSPRPPRMVTRHLDGIRTHNNFKNLKWGTKKENYADSRAHKTNCQGERNGYSVLTEENVKAIKALRASGQTLKVIGSIFKTHWSNVWLICKGETWKHLTEPASIPL